MFNDLKIIKEFQEIIKEETQDYNLKDFLNDQCRYGQTVFTYYIETTNLYDEYKEDCDKWLDNLVGETGLDPWELFPMWDYTINSETNKWNVIVSMFENYCDYLLEDLEQEKNRKRIRVGGLGN